MISASSTEPGGEVNGDLAVCRLRQFAKYMCPSCNVPYCSLTCFRSDSHGECSEGFYRKEVETDIQSEPSKTAEERLRMMELLKKFEQDSLKHDDGDGDDSDGEGSDDDTNELSKRLRGVDIDSTLPDDLWTLLTPSQQQKFLKALRDPSSELTQQLLASEQIEKEMALPWWNGDATYLEFEDDGHGGHESDGKEHGKDPCPMQIPARMVKPVDVGSSLVYNIVAVLIAYAYTTRSFAASPLSCIPRHSPDVLEAQRAIARLTPFLIEKRATTVFGSTAEVVTDVWARLGQDTVNNEAMSVFLGDAARLVRPLAVVSLQPFLPLSNQDPEPSYDYNAHPHRRHTKVNATTQKLVFYGARLLALPSHVLTMVAQELEAHIELMKRHGQSSSGGKLAMARARTVGGNKPLVMEV